MKSEEKKYPELVVGGIIVNKEGKILFVRSTKWRNKYSLPGGHVELGESLIDAAVREIKEEVGIRLDVRDKIGFGEVVFSGEYYKEKHFIFLVYLFEYNGEKIKLGKEINGGYVWADVQDVSKLDLTEVAKKILDDYLLYLKRYQYLDSWKRCQADFENYKKDQAKRQEEFRRYAKMDTLEQILPVLDNFEVSLEHIPEKDRDSAWVTGITHIKRQMEDILKNNGVEEIMAKIGDKFNPEIHEAVAGKGEKVKKIIQKGYKLNGRIIRAVKVEVE